MFKNTANKVISTEVYFSAKHAFTRFLTDSSSALAKSNSARVRAAHPFGRQDLPLSP